MSGAVTPMSRHAAAINEFTRRLPDDKRLLIDRIFAPGRPVRNAAVEQGERRLTFGQLGVALSERLGRLSGKVTLGDLVAIERPKSIDYVVDFLAVLTLGGIPIPFDPDLPPARREVLLGQLPALVMLRDGGTNRVEPGLARSGTAEPDTVRSSAWRSDGDVEDGAYVFCTSGSTGLPKPVLGSARGLRRFLSWQSDEFGIGVNDRVAFLTPLGFDVSLRDMFLPLWSGATLVIPDEGAAESPESTVGWLRSRAITALHVVPSIARAWLRAGREICDTLRIAFFAGEPLPASLLREWPDLFPGTSELVNLYGPTETTLAKFWHRIGKDDLDADPVPVGLPLPGTRSCLLGRGDRFDAESIRLRANRPHGEGEIVIVTPHSSHGYLGQPAATAERFIDLGGGLTAYRTGDLGRRRRDGRLVVVGRTDDEIKIDGVRIHPAEVTNALRTVPGIRDAFVVSVPSPDGRSGGSRHRLVAYVVAAEDAPSNATPSGPSAAQALGSSAAQAFGSPTERRIRAELADRLPRAMLPSRVVELAALPVTANGKVDRAALLAAARDAVAAGPFVEPAGDIERWLAAQWADLLSAQRISATDEFFSLGGTSIFAMQVVSRIRRKFDLDVSLSTIFAEPTVRTLAAQISRLLPDADAEARRIPVIDRSTGRIPMSFAQRRLYFLQAFEPDSPAYNIAEAVRLRGRLRIDRLRRSLRAIVARHEVLRTICVHDGDDPELLIVDPDRVRGGLGIEVIDRRRSAGHTAFAEVRELLAGRCARPFRLDAEPPLRATLVRLADEDHVLLFVTHHIASDEWSSRLFMREFLATYLAAGDGEQGESEQAESEQPESAPPPFQYADFAAWQRAQLTEEVAAAQLGYWRERLSGMPPTLELPIGGPRPEFRSGRAGEVTFTLGSQVYERLHAVSRRISVTPFAVLLTAFAFVLHRHCATEDVVVGSPVAGRTHPETEGLLGCFINTLALRLDLSGTPTCRQLVQRARDCVLGALEHQDLPFDRLVAELRSELDLSAGQLLQVMFNHHEAITVAAPGSEPAVEQVGLPKPGAQFDLACTVVDHGDTMAAHLVYAVDLLSPALVTRLGEHFTETLDALLADIDAPMDALPAVPGRDAQVRTPTRASRPAAAREASAPPLAIARFEAHAAAGPDRPAVRCLADVAGYGELNRCANRLARHLVRSGITPGDVIALLYERSVDLVVAMLAAQKAGATYVPLDPVFPAGHVATILDESRAKLMLTHEAVDSAEVASRTAVGIVAVEPIAALLAGYPDTDLDLPIDPASAVYILFTSGSSGRPKGVVVEHRNLASFLAGMLSRMALPEHLSFANVTTFAADLGLTNVYGALTNGGTLHVIPYELATDPEPLADYFRRHPIDFMKSVPSHLQAMNEAGVLDAVLPSRYLALAGEAFPWHLVDSVRRARPGCEIWNHYGPTETTIDVLAYQVAPDAADRPGATVPIGFPIDRVRAHVVDRRLRPVPIGTPGELLICGASVARGYLAGDGPAAAAFIPDPFSADPPSAGRPSDGQPSADPPSADQPSADPDRRAYRTGDRVRLLPDGALEFLGRIDRQTKIRGYRVEPSHVEATLRGQPDIADVAVAVRQDAQRRSALVAYYVREKGSARALPARVLYEYASSRLPPYMVPAAFVALDRLPITPNGKLDWRAMPEPNMDAGRDRDAVPARHARDERIIEIWRSALGVATVGIDDDFFELGGDSLTAMHVVREIGEGLRVISLFQRPTVRGLADSIEAAARSGDRGDDRLLFRMSESPTPPGPGTPGADPIATIVAVPFGGGNAAGYHDLARALPPRFPLYAVELPGREFGNAAQPLEPFDHVVERVVTEARETISGPILVYGHCVGAAMAFAIAQRLDIEGADVVGAVFGAAYPSPHLPGRFFDLWARLMPSDRWKADRLYQEMLRAIGGFTEAVDKAEQQLIVRALRHDSRGADAYCSRHCHDPRHERRLAALCVVGERDRITEFSAERHREWNMLCARTDLAVIPDAGHYFLKHQAADLADTLVTWIERRRATPAADPDGEVTSATEPAGAPETARLPERGRDGPTTRSPTAAPPVRTTPQSAARPAVNASLWRFAMVSLSQLLSMTGTRISAFGLGVWVYLETGSATMFSFILVCAVLPGLLVLPFAGAAVDRWNRRLVMIASDIIGVSGTGICLVLYAAGALEIWHIYIAAGLGAIANAFQQPAYIAATTQLVPKQYLARVSGVIQALVALSQTTGPLLGAALIVYVGVGGVLAIDVATLCFSVATLAAVRFPDTLFRKREEPVWKEVIGGFRYIARRRGFVAMNAYFLVYNLILGFVIALTPPMVLSFASAGTLSLATTLGGAGGVAGGLAMALWGGFERRATGMVGFCVLTGIGMIIVGLRPSPLFPIIGLAAIGASIALLNGHWQTLIQNKVGMELQGRMITTNRMIANLTEPLGYFCAGWLADVLFEPAMRPGGWLSESAGGLLGTGPGRGMALLIVVLGAVEIAVAVIGLRWRTLHYMEDALPDAIPGPVVTWDRDRLQETADRILESSQPRPHETPPADVPVRA